MSSIPGNANPVNDSFKDFKFRDRELAERTLEALRLLFKRSSDGRLNPEDSKRPDARINIMHVCGGHQDTLVRFGLDDLLEETGVHIIQGPGCPVCVTPQREIEEIMTLAGAGKTVAVFGDMMRVPGLENTLFDIRAAGGRVLNVYSVEDAVKHAREHPGEDVVYMGIGFETTAPSSAAALLAGGPMAPPGNFYLYSTHKAVPPAMKAIVESGELNLDGLIEPGHVCAISGTRPYEFLSSDYGIPQAVSGFEPLDLLTSTFIVAKMASAGEARLVNNYRRVVREEGNTAALGAMETVFVASDAEWRGFGVIPDSGMSIAPAFEEHDAAKAFEDILAPLRDMEFKEPPGCRCGEVLRGVITSLDCPLFGKTCTPANPVGPCMVTAEGSCQIMLKHGKRRS